jgi:hypothetical protein
MEEKYELNECFVLKKEGERIKIRTIYFFILLKFFFKIIDNY